jgi:hypothetical protein
MNLRTRPPRVRSEAVSISKVSFSISTIFAPEVIEFAAAARKKGLPVDHVNAAGFVLTLRDPETKPAPEPCERIDTPFANPWDHIYAADKKRPS